MPAFLEPCDYVLRFGPQALQYGDPYIGSMSVIRRGDEAELVGYAPGNAGLPQDAKLLHRDILRCLAENGLKVAIVRRLRSDGSVVVKRFDLTARSRK